MAQLEVALRFLGFVLIAALFPASTGGWLKTSALVQRQIPRSILAVISATLGIITLFGLLWFYVYHGFGYQPIFTVWGTVHPTRWLLPLMMGQALSLPLPSWISCANMMCPQPFSWWAAMWRSTPKSRSGWWKRAHRGQSHLQSLQPAHSVHRAAAEGTDGSYCRNY